MPQDQYSIGPKPPTIIDFNPTADQQRLWDTQVRAQQANDPEWKKYGRTKFEQAIDLFSGLVGLSNPNEQEPGANYQPGAYDVGELFGNAPSPKALLAGLPFLAVTKGRPVYHGGSAKAAVQGFNPRKYDLNDVMGWLTHFAENPRYANKYAIGDIKGSKENPTMIQANLGARNVLDLVDPNADDMSAILGSLKSRAKKDAYIHDFKEARRTGRLQAKSSHYREPESIDPAEIPIRQIAENLRLSPEEFKNSPFDAIRYNDMQEKSWAVPAETLNRSYTPWGVKLESEVPPIAGQPALSLKSVKPRFIAGEEGVTDVLDSPNPAAFREVPLNPALGGIGDIAYKPKLGKEVFQDAMDKYNNYGLMGGEYTKDELDSLMNNSIITAGDYDEYIDYVGGTADNPALKHYVNTPEYKSALGKLNSPSDDWADVKFTQKELDSLLDTGKFTQEEYDYYKKWKFQEEEKTAFSLAKDEPDMDEWAVFDPKYTHEDQPPTIVHNKKTLMKLLKENPNLDYDKIVPYMKNNGVESMDQLYLNAKYGDDMPEADSLFNDAYLEDDWDLEKDMFSKPELDKKAVMKTIEQHPLSGDSLKSYFQKYGMEGSNFSKAEMDELLNEGIIGPSEWDALYDKMYPPISNNKWTKWKESNKTIPSSIKEMPNKEYVNSQGYNVGDILEITAFDGTPFTVTLKDNPTDWSEMAYSLKGGAKIKKLNPEGETINQITPKTLHALSVGTNIKVHPPHGGKPYKIAYTGGKSIWDNPLASTKGLEAFLKKGGKVYISK